ncbi:MAG: DUF2141 domain-containing protein [Planctomycetes bacterium]|nr:DUF2141 domain-containing protein [Planctomycetota bacterium]
MPEPAPTVRETESEVLDAKAQSFTRKIVVIAEGIESKIGNCRIALYDNESSFNDPERAVAKVSIPIDSNRIVWEYDLSRDSQDSAIAIAVFHDANANDILDKNVLGIPIEKYGFSRNPTRGLGPPRFEACSLRLVDESTEISIQIK